MSDQGKIWFIYLTDHHEGPFSAQEVAEKAKQGLVNGQTLAWKDGMAEWVPAETIPELASAFGAAPAPSGDVSLAQLLAAEQNSGGISMTESSEPSLGLDASGGPTGSALSSLVSAAAPAAAPAQDSSQPGPEEEVWTLRVGTVVSGLHSLNRLKELAGDGEIPADAALWRQGWTDFQPVNTVQAVASARRVKAAGATRAGIKSPSFAARPGGLAPITAAADVGSDEPTDPLIKAPGKSKFAFLGKLTSILQRKPKAAPVKTGAVVIGKNKSGSMAGVGVAVKKIAMIVLVVGALGGAGAAYFLFFASPIPSDLDVLPDDKENLALLVKEPLAQGKKFAIAQARGTEDNPADDTAPKFYVASNMPEGTKITLSLVGKPGTLVNKINFEKSYTADIAKTHLATFELQDDGKPLAMGEYTIKVSAEGAEPYDVTKFLGGKKGAVYDRRLKQYREKLEKEYADEVEEIRELVSTLKNLQAEVSKRLADFKAAGAAPANRARLAAEWRSFGPAFDGMAGQLEAKLKARLDAPDQRYYPRAYQDISSTLAQLRLAAKGHGERLSNQPPTTNPEELEGFVQAGVLSLEQVVAQAVVKTPFDVQRAAPAAPPAK
ncbi:MAG: GYF domain-containing protein [Bacteriovoracia bacterium]